MWREAELVTGKANAQDGAPPVIAYGAWDGEAPNLDVSPLACECEVMLNGKGVGRIFTEGHTYYFDYAEVYDWVLIPDAVSKSSAQTKLRDLLASGKWSVAGGVLMFMDA